MNAYRLYQEGNFTSTYVFSLWGTVIALAIIVTIAATIITHIVFGAIHMARTNEEESFIADERDRLIQLKGTRNSYVMCGFGVFLSMGRLVLNMPVLVMFNLLIFTGMMAEIIGNLSRLYLYRRGV